MKDYFIVKNINWILLAFGVCFLFLLSPSFQGLLSSETTAPFAFGKKMDSIVIVISLLFVCLPAVLVKMQEFYKNRDNTKSRIHAISILVFCVAVFACFSVNEFSGDDLVFQTMLDNKYLSQFLKERYYGWTSRIFVETILLGMVNISSICWKVFTSFCFVCIFESLCKICLSKQNESYALVVYLFALFVPSTVLHDAGWAATTVNYVWPLAAAMPAFIILNKLFRDEPVTSFEKVYAAVLLPFACNMDQLALVVFFAYLAFFFYKIYQDKSDRSLSKKMKNARFFTGVILMISFLSLVFILLSPGNHARMLIETKNWFPDFGTFSVIQKMMLGVVSTAPFFYCSGYAYPANFLLLLLVFFIAAVLIRRRNYKVALLLIPIVVIVLLNYYPIVMVKHGQVPPLNYFFFSNICLGGHSFMSSGKVLLEISLYVLMTVALFVTIFKCFEDRKKAIAVCVVFFAGICTRLTMGFSPTVYASATRTFFLMVVSILIVCTFLLNELLELDTTKKVLCIVGLVSLFFTICVYNLIKTENPVFAELFYKSETLVLEQDATHQSTAPHQSAAPSAPNEDVNAAVKASQLPNLEKRKFKITDLNCGFHVDLINGVQAVESREVEVKGNELVLTGWVIDLDKVRPISHLYAEVKGKVYEGQLGFDRPDVKDAFKLSFSNIGFQLAIPTADLEVGSTFNVYMEGEAEDYLYEPLEYKVVKKE